MTLSIVVQILKQVQTAQLLATVNDFHDTPVIYCDFVFDTALALEPEHCPLAAERGEVALA